MSILEIEKMLEVAKSQEIENQKRIEQQKQLSEKRKELFEDVEVMQKMAIDFAKANELESSKHYAELAKETEKQAREIILDGESTIVEDIDTFVPSSHFGKGGKWSFFPIGRILLLLVSIGILGFVSHEVQGMKTQMSISFYSEMEHFGITLVCWSLMWFSVDFLLYQKYRAFYDYLNTSSFPQHDLVSQCLDSKYPQLYVLSFYCFQAFTFVLMYLHSPITNS